MSWYLRHESFDHEVKDLFLYFAFLSLICLYTRTIVFSMLQSLDTGRRDLSEPFCNFGDYHQL